MSTTARRVIPDQAIVSAALSHWSAPPTTTTFAGRYRCDNLGKQFLKPVARTRLERIARLDPPSWKNSVIQWPALQPWSTSAGSNAINVSAASVVRSRFRADQVVQPPADAKPVWTGPAEEPVDAMSQYIMLTDDALMDEARIDIDKKQWNKNLRGDILVAYRRRVYTDEEQRTLDRWNSALYSDAKYEATTPRGTGNDREFDDLWPYLTEPVGANRSGRDLVVRRMTSTETETGFATMTALVLEIAKKEDLKGYCDAKTASGQTFQAAELTLRLNRFGGFRYMHPAYLLAARIVYQKVALELKLRDLSNERRQLSALENSKQVKHADPLLRIMSFMVAPGRSSYEAEVEFNKDASALRERLNTALGAIEGKYGRYCKALPIPPQSRVRPWYNIDIGSSPNSCRWVEPYRFPGYLAPGFACHYTTEERGACYCCEREYTLGAKPLITFYTPLQARHFDFDASTSLPAPLGLPFANSFQRWAAAWFNRNVVQTKVPERFPIKLRGEWRGKEDVEAKADSGHDDLVNELAAHSERGDDHYRVRESYKFDAIEKDDPLFSDDAYDVNTLTQE
jgi:hypothetical protein